MAQRVGLAGLPEYLEHTGLDADQAWQRAMLLVESAQDHERVAKKLRASITGLLNRSRELQAAAENAVCIAYENAREQNDDPRIVDVVRLLWDIFECDVRYLIDHVDEDDCEDEMVYAAVGAQVGLRAIIHILSTAQPTVLSLQRFLKFISKLGKERETIEERMYQRMGTISSSVYAHGDALPDDLIDEHEEAQGETEV